MKKLFFLIFILSSFAIARDNPFETSSITKLPQAGINVDEPTDMYLQKEEIKLPSNARKLKKVTVEYIGIDGVTRKKEVTMDLAIDHHIPISIGQEKPQPKQDPITQSPQKVEDDGGKNSTITIESDKTTKNQKQPSQQSSTEIQIVPDTDSKHKDSDKTKNKDKDKDKDKEQDKDKDKDKTKKNKDKEQSKDDETANIEEYEAYDFLGLRIQNKEVMILTRESKVRDFAIADPANKIVVDFETREQFDPQKIKLKNKKYFNSISVGSHKDFMRVAIELTGKYTYKLKETDEGYKVVIK